MELKKHWERCLRGWLPKEPFISCSRGKAGGKGWAAYVVGYGVGMGICELLILSIYLLGWGNIEGSFRPIMNVLSNWFITILGAAVAMIIGRQLSKKLQERWRVRP
jgi:hypothetical protein